MAPSIFRFALALSFIGASVIAADRPRDIAESLAMQESMRNARDFVIRGEHAKAVDLLEKQLDRVNGDPAFLALLREAYTGLVKDLELAGKTESVELYRKRLAVFDKPALKPAVVPIPAVPEPEKPRGPVARGARPDDDPFMQPTIVERQEATEFLARAEQAFAAQRYEEASELFARANVVRPTLTDAQRSQWSYSIINCAVNKLNSPNPPSIATVQNEIQAAQTMTSKDSELYKFAEKVLRQLAERGGKSGLPMPDGPIKHTPAADGWAKAESANFRLYHNQPREAAEQIVRLAEQHRATAIAKWASTNPSAWTPVCDLYVYAQGADYAKATGQPATAPGHSTIKAQNGKVQARRMDLRGDDPNFLGSVLAHEITHVVLGDLFADQQLPRWADEGMAVLSEPRSQVDRYGKTLINCRKKGQLVPLATLVAKSEYPDATAVTVFYVESVSVVEFLVNQKGPAEFVQFMRDVNRGFDSALVKHYNLRNVAELQDRWLRATFTEVDRLASNR